MFNRNVLFEDGRYEWQGYGYGRNAKGIPASYLFRS